MVRTRVPLVPLVRTHVRTRVPRHGPNIMVRTTRVRTPVHVYHGTARVPAYTYLGTYTCTWVHVPWYGVRVPWYHGTSMLATPTRVSPLHLSACISSRF